MASHAARGLVTPRSCCRRSRITGGRGAVVLAAVWPMRRVVYFTATTSTAAPCFATVTCNASPACFSARSATGTLTALR